MGRGELHERLRRHVQRLAGEIGERNVLVPPALRAAEQYIRESFGALGYSVVEQSMSRQGVTSANLEASLPGTDRPGEILLVGAHYDTVPGSPGADDNASAVAALLELARLHRDSPSRRTVRFVASPTRSRRSSTPGPRAAGCTPARPVSGATTFV